MDVKQFIKDRDEAFLSMDKDKILEYCHKYGVPVPDNELVFWAGIHKAICALASAPQTKKDYSRKWLLDHGFSSEIKFL